MPEESSERKKKKEEEALKKAAELGKFPYNIEEISDEEIEQYPLFNIIKGIEDSKLDKETKKILSESLTCYAHHTIKLLKEEKEELKRAFQKISNLEKEVRKPKTAERDENVSKLIEKIKEDLLECQTNAIKREVGQNAPKAVGGYLSSKKGQEQIYQLAGPAVEVKAKEIIPKIAGNFLEGTAGQKIINTSLETAAEKSSVIERSAIGKFARAFSKGIVILASLLGLSLIIYFGFSASEDSARSLKKEINILEGEKEKQKEKAARLGSDLSNLASAVLMYSQENARRFDDPEEGIFPKLSKLNEGLEERVDQRLLDKGYGDYEEYKGKINDAKKNYEIILNSFTGLKESVSKKADSTETSKRIKSIEDSFKTFNESYDGTIKKMKEDLEAAKINKQEYETLSQDLEDLKDSYKNIMKYLDILKAEKSEKPKEEYDLDKPLELKF